MFNVYRTLRTIYCINNLLKEQAAKMFSKGTGRNFGKCSSSFEPVNHFIAELTHTGF